MNNKFGIFKNSVNSFEEYSDIHTDVATSTKRNINLDINLNEYSSEL